MRWWPKRGPATAEIAAADRKAALAVLRQLADQDLLPEPWDLTAFVSRVARWRDRPIRLHGKPADYWATGEDGDYLSGLFIPQPKADHIFYRVDGGRDISSHIVGHEMYHLVCGHTPTHEIENLLPKPAPITDTRANAVFGETITDPEILRRALGCARSRLINREEREAEAFADLIMTVVSERGNPDQRRLATLLGREEI